MSNPIELYTQVPSYTNLKEVVAVYLNRDDQATIDSIPFFINAAEKTILRNLRMPSMEKIAKMTYETYGNTEEGFFLLPKDYLEMKNVWIHASETDNQSQEGYIRGKNPLLLQRVPFEQITEWQFPNEIEGSVLEMLPWTVPRGIWAIAGNRMYVRGVAANTEIFLNYYYDVPEIGTSIETNVLLNLVPDAFVFLAVAEGWRFLQENERAEMWANKGHMRLDQVMKQVSDAEYSGSPLTIKPSYG